LLEFLIFFKLLYNIQNLQSGATPTSAPPVSAQTKIPDNMPEDDNSAAASLPCV
jgi:hypothetical protein